MSASPDTDPPLDSVEQVLDLARRAPSVHNTQPWRWEVDASPASPMLKLYADPARQLHVSDPVGRNLVISCGAELHHVRMIARACGWTAEVDVLPDFGDADLLARVVLHRDAVSGYATDVLRDVEDRCTDRRRFTAWPIPDERLLSLADRARHWGAHATVVSTGSDRLRVERLVRRAIDDQARDPRYADEQRGWLDHGQFDGIPSSVLDKPPSRRPLPGLRLSRFTAVVAPQAASVLEGTDGLIVLATQDDGRLDWLNTGQALSALWLRAARSGLSVVPLSQVVEVEETRLSLRYEVIGPSLWPQLLLRVGWQEIGRHGLVRTPRRPVADVVRPAGRHPRRGPTRSSARPS